MITQRIINLSLKIKIQLIIFSCIFIVACSGFISIFFISNTYKKVFYQTLSQSMNHTSDQISEQLDMIDSAADFLFSNQLIQSQLAEHKRSTSAAEKNVCRTNIYSVLYDYLYNSNADHISCITFYQDNQVICTSNLLNSNIPNFVKTNLFQQAEEAEGATVWVTDYSQSTGLFLVKEVREISGLSLEQLGIMVIKVDLKDMVASALTYDSSYEDAAYLLLDQNILLYHSPSILWKNALLLRDKLTTNYHVITLDNEDFFTVQGNLQKYDWRYIYAIPYTPITRTISTTMKFSSVSIIFCIILLFLSSTMLLSSLIRHFDVLTDKMKRFGSGCYKPMETSYDYSKRKDEIGLLHTNFDSMAQKVDTLIEENYVNELLKREAQIKSMESQMDPHFLYNTLDSINWRARAIGATDISQITNSLGNLLRISLNKNTALFTIREELSVLDHYITIQKMRYQKRLSYSIDVPQKLLDYEIPKLTLQPLLENSIRYGLEEISEICFISVQARELDDTIIIEVKNNGSSFDEDLLNKLLSQEVVPHGFGIGITNIHKRIQLTYGIEYGLTLYNMEDNDTGEEFSIVRVTLPKRKIIKGENEHV